MNTNQEEHKSKSKILAILFNVFFPGLGYFYIGDYKKSLFFIIGLIILIYAFYYSTDYFKNAYIFLSLFPIIAFIYFYSTFDVIKIISRKEDRDYKINKWYYMPLLIIIISFLETIIIEISPIRYFNIPSKSMSSTIQQGDHLVVKKDVRKVLRAEIVVFKYPKDPDVFFIKRCVAVSGDKIFMKDKILYLQPHEGADYIKKNYPLKNIVTINNSLWVKNPYKQSIKTIKNDDKVVDDGSHHAPLFHFNKITIPEDSYFVMGDNRDHANDSRFWGYIETKDIFGIFNGVICFNFKDLNRINLKIK